MEASVWRISAAIKELYTPMLEQTGTHLLTRIGLKTEFTAYEIFWEVGAAGRLPAYFRAEPQPGIDGKRDDEVLGRSS